jgi:predicted transcriptional regulator
MRAKRSTKKDQVWVSFKCDESLKDHLFQVAQHEDRTAGAVVREALRERFARDGAASVSP